MLNEDSGRASQEVMAALARVTLVVLNPLVSSDDKSQVIRPELILTQPAVLETRPAGQGLIIRTNFTNPQVAAGRYTGPLEVRSEGLLIDSGS